MTPRFDGRRLRVLVVENEWLIGMDLEEILAGQGFDTIGPISTVAAALDAVGQQHVDMAILDFRLRDGTSERIAAALTEAHVPFIICTGDEAVVLRSRYPQAPLLAKPYNPDEVLTAVIALTARRLAL